MDPQNNGTISSTDSSQSENTSEVGENYSEDSNVYPDTVSQSYRCANVVWPYSPIPSCSDGYNPHTAVKSESFDFSNTAICHKAVSELYQYSSVPYHDYANIYHSQYAEWQQMHQWYYTSNYYNSDRAIKYPDISLTPQNTHSMNSAPNNVQTSDIARCSTPDLISALAAIPSDSKFSRSISPLLSEANQVLSNESPKADVSPNVSVISEHGNHSMYLHVANRVQDSGYNSDLCMSPVYPLDSKLNSPKEEVKSENSDEENKENADPGEESSMNLSQFIEIYNTTKPYMPKPNLADFLRDPAKVGQNDISIQNSDEVQSMDITSSSLSSPTDQKLQQKAVLCHKMPQQPQRPNIKKCEAAKRKITDAEIQAVMQRESKRQRHNQPLNLKAVHIMTEWYEAHEENPYPSKSEKEIMAKEGGISITQVKSWFANKRNRSNNTKPKVQKRQMTERLLDICHQLARTAKQPTLNNADIIQQLSTIITNPGDSMGE
ncbi:uncharacterized protein LOC133181949 [Saccostrea echinata]|uniref:uncharacterized protein LOC133181949 n=1 Tax=Saccostrea echinata TaxID=191078 RepID=UPI002A7F656C|nr:uncharacterized protein LOC133181949 [Saccostrea echinata]